MAPVQSWFDFGGCFAKLRACFDLASRKTPARAWAAVIASFNPGIQQMLQIGPHMPSIAQPPSKWPFNFNCSPQRGPIKAEASRARITDESFEGRRPQGRLANGFTPVHTLCENANREAASWMEGCPRKGSRDAVQMAASVATTQTSIPRAQNFQNEIYGAGPPSLGRKHLLQQLWERLLIISFCAGNRLSLLTGAWCEIKVILRWEQLSTFSSLHFVS